MASLCASSNTSLRFSNAEASLPEALRTAATVFIFAWAAKWAHFAVGLDENNINKSLVWADP
jgi:hypothetical protein